MWLSTRESRPINGCSHHYNLGALSNHRPQKDLCSCSVFARRGLSGLRILHSLVPYTPESNTAQRMKSPCSSSISAHFAPKRFFKFVSMGQVKSPLKLMPLAFDRLFLLPRRARLQHGRGVSALTPFWILRFLVVFSRPRRANHTSLWLFAYLMICSKVSIAGTRELK